MEVFFRRVCEKKNTTTMRKAIEMMKNIRYYMGKVKILMERKT